MLELDRVSARLGGKDILKDVSFSLRPEKLTALVGRNGSGKSTLLACVNQQLSYAGSIREGAHPLEKLSARERARRIALLPQTIPAPHIPAREMVALGRNPYLDFTGRLTREDQSAVDGALAEARAEELARRYVDSLSGGERQRVALAMILAQNTPIALLDEPTAHMDQHYGETFLRLLRQLGQEKKKTVLVVLHDLTLAVRYADDIVVLEEGRVIFSGTKEACLAGQILEQTFGLRRCEAEGKIFFSAE